MSRMEPNLPPDLLEVARTLETAGPCMTETEFARVRRTAVGRANASRRQGVFTRSRLAMTSMLAMGALMSTGGAALGVSALSTDLSARAAQYGTSSSNQGAPQTLATPVAAPTTGSAAQSGSGGVVTTGSTPSEDTRGSTQQTDDQGVVKAAAAQAPRQLTASQAGKLPFTGYAAIPLLLLGLALFVTGCVMRRSSRSTPAQT